MNNDLDKIIAWSKVHSPQTLEHLNGPASDDDIKAVESTVGHTLPDSFKELLGQIDGEDSETWLALFGDGNQMLSCKRIIEQYILDQQIAEQFYDPEMESIEFWKDRVGGNIIFVKGSVKPLMRHPDWLPFTSMNGDVFRFLDFDPAPGGMKGQVIEVDPESCSYRVLASDMRDFIAMYARQLESGAYKVDEEGDIQLRVGEDVVNWGMPQWLKDADS